MKTFFITYLIIQSIALIIWLWGMLSKPTLSRGRNRFHSNWIEGGNIVLVIVIFISLGFAIGISKLILGLTFLEKYS